MEVRIQAIHFDATEKLQDFIQKKTAKLEKYCDDINKVEVSLKVVKPETAMNKEASIKVLVPNGEFFAEKVSDTFEESVDVCVDALSKQIGGQKHANATKPATKPVDVPAWQNTPGQYRNPTLEEVPKN